jgi:hypothetical protein
MRKIENSKFKIENLGISFLIIISSLFKLKPKAADLEKMEFSTSTQKMGVGFTDKIREIFRYKWMRKAGK